MAKIRCSNCEKSINYREKTGKVYVTKACKSTGEKISGQDYFKQRKCTEFLPRREYVDQFENPLDKALGLIEKGKQIKDIVEGI